jgi:hypothetical protein
MDDTDPILFAISLFSALLILMCVGALVWWIWREYRGVWGWLCSICERTEVLPLGSPPTEVVFVLSFNTRYQWQRERPVNFTHRNWYEAQLYKECRRHGIPLAPFTQMAERGVLWWTDNMVTGDRTYHWNE